MYTPKKPPAKRWVANGRIGRYLTFDVIAKISLGKDAECIETDDRNRFVETVGWAIALMGVFNRFPEVYKVVSRGWMSRYTVANSDMKYGFGPALKVRICPLPPSPNKDLSSCLPIYLSIHIPAFLSICLLVCLSVYTGLPKNNYEKVHYFAAVRRRKLTSSYLIKQVAFRNYSSADLLYRST